MFKELLTVLGSLHTVALLFYCIWTTYIVVRIQCPLNRPTFTVCKLSRRHVNYVVLFLQCIVHCTVHCQDAIWFILSISTVYTVSRRHLNYCILSQFYSVWSVKASSELYFSISTVYTVSRRHLNYIVPFLQCI